MLTATLTWAVIRIAVAILLDTAALIIWDIGTRSPKRVFLDIRNGIRDRASIARGSIRFVIGVLALFAAAVIAAPVANQPADVTIVECWALVTALVVEGLIGPDLRARRNS